MGNNLSRSIVFITGSFIGNNCWDEWIIYFESMGYNCLAPGWPYKDAPPEELRNRHPDADIASNNLADLTEYFAAIINSMPGKPIMIGHSLGGLVVQLLLHRGLGGAGVTIHSFPPPGICTFKFSFLRPLWETMAFFTSVKETYMISFRKWIHVIANGMSCEMQKELFYRYAVPESKLVIRDAFKCAAKINFESPHAPLLFISGGNDQVIPASLNFVNYQKYEATDSITHYKLFKGRNHLIFGHPAWIENAAFVLDWLQAI